MYVSVYLYGALSIEITVEHPIGFEYFIEGREEGRWGGETRKGIQ